MSSQINYIDAFDDVVIEDYFSDEEEEDDAHSSSTSANNDDNDDDVDHLVQLTDEDNKDNKDDDDDDEYEVTFLTDDDEDDDGDFDTSEDPVKSLSKDELKQAHLQRLNDKYKVDLILCNKALEGKMNWVSSAALTSSCGVVDKNDYPDVHSKPKREKKFRLKPIKNQRPMNIEIKVKDHVPSQIHMRAPQPKPPVLKKNWFCKNLIQTGTCKFGTRCIFAHTLAEVENHTEQCKFGKRCNNIRMTGHNQYVNSGKYKCIRKHPHENISNFIKRVQ